MPLNNAAMAETCLNVLPGAYQPWTARFKSGNDLSSLRRFQTPAGITGTNSLGSYAGELARASTSPLRGSITTPAPRQPRNTCSSAACTFASSVKCRS